MSRRPRTPSLFPYTTLFRSIAEGSSSELKASVGSGSLEVRVMDPADREDARLVLERELGVEVRERPDPTALDRKSTRLNSSHVRISYAVFCLKKKRSNFCRC